MRGPEGGDAIAGWCRRTVVSYVLVLRLIVFLVLLNAWPMCVCKWPAGAFL